jgi:hypothetical protein
MRRRNKFPKMILVAGDGRNVGKTFLACKIIRSLSKLNRVIGIKTSPHMHDLPKDAEIIASGPGFIVCIENQINSKDSSLMLQSGAEKVFFITAEKDRLDRAFESIKNEIAGETVVAESGGLHELLNPGLFLFVKKSGRAIEKKTYLKYQPLIVHNTGNEFYPDPIGEVNNFLKSKVSAHV